MDELGPSEKMTNLLSLQAHVASVYYSIGSKTISAPDLSAKLEFRFAHKFLLAVDTILSAYRNKRSTAGLG